MKYYHIFRMFMLMIAYILKI